MKLNWPLVWLLTGLLAPAALTQISPSSPNASAPPDTDKLSYAQGMQLGLELKQSGAPVVVEQLGQAFSDVLLSKPTQLTESEVSALLARTQTNSLLKECEKDPPKFSYALGMVRAGQLKRVGAELDPATIAQGLKDVLQAKPTRLKEADIEPLFQQAQAFYSATLAQKNKAAGQAYLAKNATQPGFSVLPDGLQYKVLEPGTGPMPTTNDLLIVKYRGCFLDGREFDHSLHYLTRSTGGLKGWQDAMQRMRVGARWQLVMPPELAFGEEGEPVHQVGPNATLLYELELISIAQPGDPLIGTGSIGHGLEGELTQPTSTK